jgi:hypothetical protein
MLSSEEKISKLRALYDLSRESEEFEDGVSFQEDMAALVVGDWAILAYDEMDDLALSFHVESHPIAVAKLTRLLVEHDVPFVLYEAFRINDQDEIVFESDLPAQE